MVEPDGTSSYILVVHRSSSGQAFSRVEEELACHGNENDSLDVDKSNRIHGDAVNNYHQNFVYLLSPGSGVVGPEGKN